MNERSTTMNRKAMIFMAALSVLAATAGADSVDQRRPAAADGRVSIENMNGTIKVIGWDKGEVWVKGSLASEASLEFSSSERQTSIEIEVEGNPMAARSDLEVHVPAGSRVEIEGFRATIDVTGVTGAVEAETVNGSITHAGAAKEVELQSVNGSIEVTGAAGRIELEAVNGTVTVRNASGQLEASSVNGQLRVSGGSFEKASLESVAGGVHFEAGLGPRASLDVETVSGTVELILPAGIGADFMISSFSGEIENELGPEAVKKSRYTPQRELAFSAGGGGARIKVETLSGTIHIRKKP
jgi:DUF4097 and DUF4098 domain-containing protein YvlB